MTKDELKEAIKEVVKEALEPIRDELKDMRNDQRESIIILNALLELKLHEYENDLEENY